MDSCFSSPRQPENPAANNEKDANDAPSEQPGTQAPAELTPSSSRQPENPAANNANDGPSEQRGTQAPVQRTPPFREYTIHELFRATKVFSRQNLLSKAGGQLPNSTYRGRLRGGQEIAVKRFSQEAWPDVELFREKAIRAGSLRHRRLVSLIGYCCYGRWRLLVAEFMPNGRLADGLFKTTKIISEWPIRLTATNNTIEWPIRLTVASYVAEAFEYFRTEGEALYFDLNPHKVLFNEAGNPCLSCFGLVKNHRDRRCYGTNPIYTPPDCVSAMPTSTSMIFSFGILLRDLLSGRQITQNQAIEVILGVQIPIIMDSRLNDEYSAEEANALLELASRCMQKRHADRPTIEQVIATLAQVQSNAGAPR